MIRTSRKSSNSKGFTLLEFIIVLAIVAILALVAIPSFRSIVQNNRIEATAENLYYNLQYARTEAIKSNSTIYVSFVTGDNWCYGINAGSACSCATPSGCSLGTVSATSSGLIDLSTTGFSGGSLAFEATHGGANAAGTITFTIYGGSSLIKLSVGSLGNIQICSTGISGYASC